MSSTTTTNANSSAAVQPTATITASASSTTAATTARRGGHPSRQKRFGPAPLASFEDLPTDDQDSSPENNEPVITRSHGRGGSTRGYQQPLQHQQHTVVREIVASGDEGGTGLNWTLRLDLDTGHPGFRGSDRSGSRGDSELSTPIAPDSDVISQITVTPTADSRNISPLQGVVTALGATDPLGTAGYYYGNNPTTGTRSSLTTSVTGESSYKDEEEEVDIVDGPGEIQSDPPAKNDYAAADSCGNRMRDADCYSGENPERPSACQGTMAGQVGVTHATIEIIHEESYQATRAYESCSDDQIEGGRGGLGHPDQQSAAAAGGRTTANMASHTAITSEAILESLLKFEEERIPLAARLERSGIRNRSSQMLADERPRHTPQKNTATVVPGSCQSIADIPSASHSRKNSSSVPQQQQLQQAPDRPTEGSRSEAGDAPLLRSSDGRDTLSTEGSQLLPDGSIPKTNNALSDQESDTDNAPERAGSPEADDDALADLSSSAGASATRRRRRKLRPQTSDDRFESLRLLPAQDSVDVEEDNDYELQLLGLRSGGPEVQVDEAPADDLGDETPSSNRDDNIELAPRTPQKQTVAPSHQRQQLVTIPIERPRSTTPINVAPLEAYIQQQQLEQTGGQPRGGASQGCPSSGGAGARSPDRLKLTLPGQHAGGNLAKSPRKGSLRNWEEFCEEALQHSPRARSKSDAAALGQRFFPDPLEFSPASPPRPPDAAEDEIQSPSDYQDPFRRRLTCSCKCRTCACLCGGCDCDCHFYTQKVFESHLNDPMSHIVEINGTPGSPREDEQSLLSPEEAATQGPCPCECHTLHRDTSCLLTAPLLVTQSSLDSC